MRVPRLLAFCFFAFLVSCGSEAPFSPSTVQNESPDLPSVTPTSGTTMPRFPVGTYTVNLRAVEGFSQNAARIFLTLEFQEVVLSPDPDKTFRSIWNVTLSESAGISANINFFRLDVFGDDGRWERVENGANEIVAEAGTNFVPANGSWSNVVTMDFNQDDVGRGFVFTANVTDATGVVLEAVFNALGGPNNPTAQPTRTLTCQQFANLAPQTGRQFEFDLMAPGTLRVVSDWTNPASDVDVHLGYCCGCPSVEALLRGGCVSLGEDRSTAKPAQFTRGISDHDLTVDPSAPGRRTVYVFNKGPSPVSGVLQVTLTSGGGSVPDGGPSCAPFPPDNVPTGGTPPPTPAPTPPSDPTPPDDPPTGGNGTCNGEPVPTSCGGPVKCIPGCTADRIKSKCKDGFWSCSSGPGTCSSHGGVACTVRNSLETLLGVGR